MDALGLAALIPSGPGYFRLALGMWSCAFTHERFVMKTLCPSRLPFPRKQPQLAERGVRDPELTAQLSRGCLGMVASGSLACWSGMGGSEAQVSCHHPLLPLVLGSDSLWP